MKIVLKEKKIERKYENKHIEIKNQLNQQKSILEGHIKILENINKKIGNLTEFINKDNVNFQEEEEKAVKLLSNQFITLENQVIKDNQEIFDILDSNVRNLSEHEDILLSNSTKIEKLDKDTQKLSSGLNNLLNNYDTILENNNKIIHEFNQRFQKMEEKMESTEKRIETIEQKYINFNLKLDRNLKKFNTKFETLDIELENTSLKSDLNKKNINIITSQQHNIKKQIDANVKEYDSILGEHYKKMEKNKAIISDCLNKMEPN
ncbi:hypothetical protein CPAV1605_266 [seawater metagenome]|uniref:Uncharacterized protein n=1 Tax=seawater metagenome TaxID=1561972 RepID=A0A5E8CH70_9ZZZZ